MKFSFTIETTVCFHFITPPNYLLFERCAEVFHAKGEVALRDIIL